jgi:hydrogenase-1 operon protein HyaF
MTTALPAFPIPVVSLLGPGSQPEDDAPAYLQMPQAMATFHAPVLPEPEALVGHGGALAALRAARAAIDRVLAAGGTETIDLHGLDAGERALVAQVLGEGEVAVQVAEGAADEATVQAQESVFAGVWRVLRLRDGQLERDTIEVGAVPQAVLEAAHGAALDVAAARTGMPADAAAAATMNAPSILAELRDRSRRRQPGEPAHVVNLSLLPLTDGDSWHLEAGLGRGRVTILSRGYGNCRVVDLQLAHGWRVTYFNSQDLILLDTLEVGAVPEVACAAREDLEDSAARLDEVLQWVRAP